MILGVGIDIVEVSRVKSLVRRKTALSRIFTAAEINYCRTKKYPAESFAARFAAKEAFLKAIGTGWGTAQSPKWVEIQIIPISRDPVRGTNSKSQAPNIKITGKAKAIARKLGVKQIHISLSHTKQQAVALVILEK